MIEIFGKTIPLWELSFALFIPGMIGFIFCCFLISEWRKKRRKERRSHTLNPEEYARWNKERAK